MKAVRVHTPGGPEVLIYEDMPDPTPGPGEALVELKVIGVNYSDTHYRKGNYPNQVMSLPLVPGHEATGIVRGLGEGVSHLKVGEWVAFAGQHRYGTYKELMALPAINVVPLPAGIEPKLAVAVLNQGQTAHYLCHDARPLKEGESVLIHAGAGGVGSNLVQMAKMLGAYVYTTVSTEEKAEFVRDLGADEVILYTQVDFEEEIKKRTNGEGVNVVFDSIGGDNLMKSLRSVARKGHVLTYGQSSGSAPPPLQWPIRGTGSIYLSNHTGADYNKPGEENIGRAHEIFRWVREGQLKVHIHEEYALADAAKAHHDIESRGTIGKLLLIP